MSLTMAANDFMAIPILPREATKFIMDKITSDYKPLITRIHDIIQSLNDENAAKLGEVFTLCLSQIIKCLLNLFEIFRLEYSRLTNLKESRKCNLDRLSWCFHRLVLIDTFLEKQLITSQEDISINESLNITNMYFVNWIDHTFDILSKLAELAYKTDYKDNEDILNSWKSDMVECISSLHISVDELLLCAMTLCKYSLPADQTIVKARCQVVLRETKALLAELMNGDVNTSIVTTIESLKLPIMPSNVNVLIDVLKDVLYILETNTNTALLALLINCFSASKSSVDVLKEHFKGNIQDCLCGKSEEEGIENCPLVEEFDLYNERLMQIGSFAISCSSDQNRILSLRSGLASLEALDPHLVPALLTSPDNCHAMLLMKSWKQEVQEIRNSVFLIVDPAAFSDKSKQMMHQRLLEVLNEGSYDNTKVCSVIDIGCVVNDFFNVYIQYEPEALTGKDKLMPLLADLHKVQEECKIVSNLLSKEAEFRYDVKSPKAKETSLEQLHKRLKLFYTLIGRINSLYQPKETENSFENECEEAKNVTHTIIKNGNTYVNSPKKFNISRSIFARTNVRCSTRNFPLAKLTKNLRSKNCSQLNFSVQLDLLNEEGNEPLKNVLTKVREQTFLYNFSPIKNRSSLRKVILNRHLQSVRKNLDNELSDDCEQKGSLMDVNDSLQLTQVLNEMNEMTSFLTTNKNNLPSNSFSDQTNIQQKANVTRIDINCDTNNITKRIWNISVNASTVDLPLCESEMENVSNLSHPSDVNTLDRISDLDFVESKLCSLKSQFETSL